MGGDLGVRGGLVGAAKECAVRAVDEGVASVKDAEGAEGFEFGGEVSEAGLGGLRDAGRGEAVLEGGEAVADVGQAEVGVVLAEACIEALETCGAGAKIAVESVFGAVG